MAAKFKCFQKALYNGKEVTIVGHRYGHATRIDIGHRYDVRVYTSANNYYDYPNIPEDHLKEIPAPQRNEVLQFVAAANLFKKNGKEA